MLILEIPKHKFDNPLFYFLLVREQVVGTYTNIGFQRHTSFASDVSQAHVGL